MLDDRITATSSIHILIGATGFEPATSRPPAVRATKLRHTPICVSVSYLTLTTIHYFVVLVNSEKGI